MNNDQDPTTEPQSDDGTPHSIEGHDMVSPTEHADADEGRWQRLRGRVAGLPSGVTYGAAGLAAVLLLGGGGFAVGAEIGDGDRGRGGDKDGHSRGHGDRDGRGDGGDDTPTTVESIDDLNALIEQAAGDPDRGLHGGHRDIQAVLTDELGLSHDELHDRMDDGQNLAAVAEEEGVQPEALVDALIGAAEEIVDQAVSDEVILDSAAAGYVSRFEDAYTARVSYTE